ncbi:MAG: biopolymer transporter ExbD [Leptolyngbyaceae cyanobacterium T60_A2020_046]|nr:biopolymer transporter ExbD [Leptolyngbyaceae cyanobacterium T60_A2020_046]
MRSRRRTPQSQLPEVNLVPMMDVLMTVLVFFVIISMTLTGQQLLGVRLPQSVTGADRDEENTILESLVVGLDSDGNILLEDRTVSFSELTQRIRVYFAENPEGKLVIKADRTLPYSEVSAFLTKLRAIGGNRVSLAVE